MRARGLKPKIVNSISASANVAPHAGAWIETYSRTSSKQSIGSRPMRARGLKHVYEIHILAPDVVAPHAGAWIETNTRQ